MGGPACQVAAQQCFGLFWLVFKPFITRATFCHLYNYTTRSLPFFDQPLSLVRLTPLSLVSKSRLYYFQISLSNCNMLAAAIIETIRARSEQNPAIEYVYLPGSFGPCIYSANLIPPSDAPWVRLH